MNPAPELCSSRRPSTLRTKSTIKIRIRLYTVSYYAETRDANHKPFQRPVRPKGRQRRKITRILVDLQAVREEISEQTRVPWPWSASGQGEGNPVPQPSRVCVCGPLFTPQKAAIYVYLCMCRYLYSLLHNNIHIVVYLIVYLFTWLYVHIYTNLFFVEVGCRINGHRCRHLEDPARYAPGIQ